MRIGTVAFALAGAVFLHAAPSAAMTLELLEDASGALAEAGGVLDIVAGPNAIVISTYGSSVLASKDGTSWRTIELSGDVRGAVLAYMNGRYWASYDGGMCMSTDGLDWSCATTGMTSLSHLTFGNGHYLASEKSTLYTSTDGVTWTQTAAPISDPNDFGPSWDYAIGGIVFDGKRFVLAQLPGTGGADATYRYFSSQTGDAWAPLAASSMKPAVVVEPGGGLLEFADGTYVIGCYCTFFEGEFWEAVGHELTSFPKSGKPVTHHTIKGHVPSKNALQGVAFLDGMVVTVASARASDPFSSEIYAGRLRPATTRGEEQSSDDEEAAAPAASATPAAPSGRLVRSSSGCSTGHPPAPEAPVVLSLLLGTLAWLRGRRSCIS